MKSGTIEVVASTVHSCIQAQQGGAHRIELCSALSTAGLTPSPGLMQLVKRSVTIPVFVMIRPREGDFCYSDVELDVIRHDIEHFRILGADGIVLGVLRRDGKVDETVTRQLVELCRPLPVTFHRAIDVTPNIYEAMETVIDTGCTRILTAGGRSTALEGRDTILAMNQRSGGRIAIMAGGGIRPESFDSMLHADIREYHLSARMPVTGAHPSTLFDMNHAETDSTIVRTIVEKAATLET